MRTRDPPGRMPRLCGRQDARRYEPQESLRKKLLLYFLISTCFTLPMHVDLGIWAKLTRMVIFLLLLAGILAVIIWYLPLIKHNEALRKQILTLDTQIRHEEERTRRIEASIRALRTDAKAVERLAREKLGLAKVGETVVRFEEAPANPAAKRPVE